jgi:hypothetical protein
VEKCSRRVISPANCRTSFRTDEVRSVTPPPKSMVSSKLSKRAAWAGGSHCGFAEFCCALHPTSERYDYSISAVLCLPILNVGTPFVDEVWDIRLHTKHSQSGIGICLYPVSFLQCNISAFIPYYESFSIPTAGNPTTTCSSKDNCSSSPC